MHVVVIGAGTGGATFAGRLCADGRHDVTLIEAGPDYGPFDEHRWPAELLDSRRIPLTHDWGLHNADAATGRTFPVARARVLGGCSAHNGCAAVRGLRSDYGTWVDQAGLFWQPDALLEDFAAVERALRVRPVPLDETSPFQRAVHAASLAAGMPESVDINDIDEGEGVSICPVNKRGGVRWNAAFGFLDPVRASGRLTIAANTQATELILGDGRVRGVRCLRDGERIEIAADAIVLAAGAYASPELLLRSGIGDRATLADFGIAARHHLPGVGRNLQDHPCAVLEYRASESLIEQTTAFESTALAFDEAIIVKARSPVAGGLVDIHMFSSGGRLLEGGWYWQLWTGLLTPRSRGHVHPLPGGGIAIEHNHFSDAESLDLAALRWGVDLTRRIAAQPALAGMLTPVETDEVGDDEWIRPTHVNYYHPAGTCAMGRSTAEGAVVDEMGRVHGVAGLMVADASIMPTIPAANTNIPTAALAHRLARHFDTILPH